MGAKSELLDAAKKVCLSDSELARRLNVTRSNVSAWRNDVHPMPDHHVITIAKIARENEGFWLARIAAEQAQGDTRRAWERVAKTLSAAASITLLVGAGFAQNALANVGHGHAERPSTVDIMRKLRELLTLAQVAFRHARTPALLA